ncbi:nucleoside-diphosphate-sugar epimerase family protein [Talaromyces pinophilus]|uniref:Nucleoside-diphosphate-sugar epimerase family protein n=1 Tax=Talaromyces pinophilus TaxID=128442 RepID=A0A6V8H2C8_TALPI|nr:nucleoside-diphosphate-sugar epimerase family protein [Talaromyces pinophilus]
MMKAVLITGATGKQGGSVIRSLVARKAPFEILAVTRNPQSASAQRLMKLSSNIKLVEGDLDKPSGIFQNAQKVTKSPIWGVFSVQAVAIGNEAQEETQGKALIDEALKQNAKFFIYSSVDRGGPSTSPTNPTRVPHFINKHNIEQHLIGRTKYTDMNWFILRPVAFFDNLTPNFFGKVFATSFKTALKGKPLQMVATSDIGDFAAEGFLHPETYAGQGLSLAGDELTFDQFAKIFEEKTGQSIPLTFWLVSSVVMTLMKEMGYMFRWFHDEGYKADILELKKMHPGLKDFGTWLETEKILAQVKELEEEVERLRSMVKTSSEENDAVLSPATTGVFNEAESSRGRLVVRDERSRSSDEESVAYATITNMGTLSVPSIGTFGSDQLTSTGTGYTEYLRPLRVQELWDVYQVNVAPMLAFMHKPSIYSLVRELGANPELQLEAVHEALILAICFAAVVSMTPQKCFSVLGEDHDTCINGYMNSVRQALGKANLIGTQDARVLQASVLFLLCLRRFADSRLVWAEAAIVVRVAQRLGVHRDGGHLGLSPFESEIRRRLWWHICILDRLCSEDQGTDTQIWPDMFDTKLPSNIDGDNLTPDLTTLPGQQEGYTDITLCIINCEVISSLYWSGKSLHKDAKQVSSSEKGNIISNLADRLETQYLRKLDLDSPIQWMTAVIGRLMLSTAWLVNRLNVARADQTSNKTTNDEIFHMALEILKFATLLQNKETTAPWDWISKTYKHRNVAAFVLSELCVRPITPETEHAWEVVSQLCNQWLSEDSQTQTHAMLHKPLARLMKRATLARRKKLEGQSAVSAVQFPGTQTSRESTTGAGTGFITPEDAESEFSFSNLDWLTGPLL